jgi:NADH-ubiquinone oxidoreductase chain 1
MITNSLNINVNIQMQKAVFFILPLFPIFLIFFIGSVAETNRAPFDLAEAESELVSGFMTEHAAVIFVFFFLAEYGSILLMCILSSALFIGGYLTIFNFTYIYDLINYIFNIELFTKYNNDVINIANNSYINGLIYGLSLGLKSSTIVFIFI